MARKITAELYESPWHLLIIVALSIFIAETVMMGVLYFLLPIPRILWNVPNPAVMVLLLVPAMLILFLFPSLVLFVLRPLRLNIRERRQVERALEQQEKNFRSLAENSPDIIMRFDRCLRYLYVNPAGERNIQLAAASIVGKTDRELGMADDLALIWEDEIRKAFADAQPSTMEIGYPAGGNSCFEARIVPEAFDDGSVHSVLVISRDITERKKAEAELRASREQLRLLSGHLQAAREEERTRIAREIHDELGQVLAAMALDIAWIESELPPGQAELREKAASMAGLIRTTIQTVQRVSAELRPVMLDDLGLAAAIRWQIREFQKRTGIACSLRVGLNSEGPDVDGSTALFRILQEALTNVLRHAQASKVNVRLTETPDSFTLQVSDNGRGITRGEIAAPRSLGVLGMRERAAFLGGHVKIHGLRQRGTTVTVVIPRQSVAMPGKVDGPESPWLPQEEGPHLWSTYCAGGT